MIKADGGATATYVYDADGRRVGKSTPAGGADFVYDLSGRVIAEWAATPSFNGWSVGYVNVAGQLLAEYRDGMTYFAHKNHLGSTRILTGMAGSQVVNGGFEQGSQGWNLCSGVPQVITDTARAHSGSNFLWASTSVYACAISNKLVSVKPGDQIQFGGWNYLEAGSSLLRWVLVAYDKNNNQVGAGVASPTTSPVQVWTQETGAYTVPSGAAYVQMYCEIYLPSVTTSARFDDAFLQVNGSAVPVVDSFDYLPFGEKISSDFGTTTHKFTGDEHDSETNTEHTWFRQLSTTQGRWLRPDPYLGSLNLRNPQSLNRYAYVLNNPLSFYDPSGLEHCEVGGERIEEIPDSVACAKAGGEWIGGDGSEPNQTAGADAGPGIDIPLVDPPSGVIDFGNGNGGENNGINPAITPTPQQTQNCLNEWNNSPVGKGAQFLSLYNFANNITSLKTWAEWTALPFAKVKILGAINELSQVGNVEFLSVTGGTSTVVTAPTAAAIETTGAVGGEVAPMAIVAGTLADMNMDAYCHGFSVPLSMRVP